MGAEIPTPSCCECDEEDKIIKNLLETSNSQFLRSKSQRDSEKYDGLDYIVQWSNKEEKSGYGAIFKAIEIQKKGMYYEGQIRQGKAEGKGRLYLFQEERKILEYNGNFKNNKANSEPKAKEQKDEYENKEIIFKGSWEDGMPKRGWLTLKNLNKTYSVHELDLKNEEGLEGHIEIDISDEEKYCGKIKKIGNIYKYHGFGKMTFLKNTAEEESFEGQWENGKMNGQGTYRWANNSKYVGNYKNGVKSGEGTYYFPDQRYYSGVWEDGFKNGIFKFYDQQNNVLYQNKFLNDLPESFSS